jgi:hypothetical protein
MDEILKTLQTVQAYLEAMSNGMNKFMAMAPHMVKQHIDLEARRKLNSTADHYKAAVTTKMVDSVLVVELDKDDWLANAVETGVGAFDMKQGLLRSNKAKVSKAGYRYMSIPIGHSKNGKPGTQKGQEFQKKINEVLMKPKVGISKLKTMMNGKVIESQKILTDDPQLQGFYRSRLFDSATEFYSGKRKPQWSYVLFRTVSENPMSKTGATWEHPGIKPVNIMRSTAAWIDQAMPKLLESFIEIELKSVDSKLK